MKAKVSHLVRHHILRLATRLLGWQNEELVAEGLYPTDSYQGISDSVSLDKIHQRFLIPSGWVVSRRSLRSVDRHGEFIPWLTYGATAWLDKLALEDMEILEFGGGASSHWFSKRSRSLTTIETDLAWKAILEGNLGQKSNILSLQDLAQQSQLEETEANTEIPSNVLARDHRWPESIKQQLIEGLQRTVSLIREASLVLVDGGPRNSYLYLVERFSGKNTILVVDNSDAEEIAETLAEFCPEKWLRIGFWGLTPINAFPAETAVFLKYEALRSRKLVNLLSKQWGSPTVPSFYSG